MVMLFNQADRGAAKRDGGTRIEPRYRLAKEHHNL